MSKEFQPYDNEIKNREFNVWEYPNSKVEIIPTMNPEEELAQQYEQLKQEAIAAGYAEGMNKAQQDLNAQKRILVQWVELLQKPVQLIDEQLVQEMIQTIIWISQQCIGVELSINQEQLRKVLYEVKEELPSIKGNKTLSLSPEDAKWLKNEFATQNKSELNDIIVSDPALQRGDFYLQSEHQELDGRLQTRFATLFAKYINKNNMSPPNEPVG